MSNADGPSRREPERSSAALTPLIADLTITGGTVVTETGEEQLDVVVRDGRIVELAPPGKKPDSRERFDAAGCLVLPGAVDVHYHARTPAYPERGDFFTETCASAAGGVTTILEMPISKPGCATPDTFRTRRQLGEQMCVTDFGLYGAPGTLIRDDVFGMAREGAVAFKIFMHRPPQGRDDEFIGICLTDESDLLEALKLCKETGLRLVAHCENDRMLHAGLVREKALGAGDIVAHGRSRPPVVEALAVAEFLTLAESVGAPVHVAHVTCRHAVQVIQRFQNDGVDVTAETCPHYLFFHDQEISRLGAYAKINPPIRTQADQDALWAALADGTLSLVATDHAPYVPAEKERGDRDFWSAPSGVPGAQVLLPLMITAALEGRITLSQAVQLIAGNPARLFGLAPAKGAITPGADADLCVYDSNAEGTLTQKRMVSKAKEIDRLYLDYPLRGAVLRTYLRGRTVFDGERIVVPAGSGAFVRPRVS
ncbi:MAG: dihydroorotase [Spirochaetaceae bacterium]|nr:MAG: dihydroorotase [Spirochaetaceae bacterium]